MSLAQKSMEKHATHAITGFELQKIALHNLQHWGLKPQTKTVLWVLIDCYNPENGSVVFPSMEYIAKIGAMGLTSAKEGIKELINKGLIIKSKRSKVSGNYNKYLLTPKVQNPTSEQSENELLEPSKSDRFMRTNKNEKINNKVRVRKTSNENDTILLDYAAKRGVAEHKLESYVIGIKQKGGEAKIISDFKTKQAADKYFSNQIKETRQLIAQSKKDAQTSAPPTQEWKDLKVKLMALQA